MQGRSCRELDLDPLDPRFRSPVDIGGSPGRTGADVVLPGSLRRLTFPTSRRRTRTRVLAASRAPSSRSVSLSAVHCTVGVAASSGIASSGSLFRKPSAVGRRYERTIETSEQISSRGMSAALRPGAIVMEARSGDCAPFEGAPTPPACRSCLSGPTNDSVLPTRPARRRLRPNRRRRCGGLSVARPNAPPGRLRNRHGRRRQSGFRAPPTRGDLAVGDFDRSHDASNERAPARRAARARRHILPDSHRPHERAFGPDARGRGSRHARASQAIPIRGARRSRENAGLQERFTLGRCGSRTRPGCRTAAPVKPPSIVFSSS